MSVLRRERTYFRTMHFSLQEGGRYVLKPKMALNCDCHGGGLRTAPKWNVLQKSNGTPIESLPQNVQRLGVIKMYNAQTGTYTERFCALDKAGAFYTQESIDAGFDKIGLGFNNAGMVRFAGTDSRYCLALILKNSCIFWKENDTYDMVAITDLTYFGCFFKHRMFVGKNPSKIAFSDAENVLDFTQSIEDGSEISFPNVGGKIVAICPFEEYLYLFFEHGILRLDVGGEAKEFVAKELAYEGGRIFGNLVQKGEQGIYFMATDGVYCLRGNDVTKCLADFVERPLEENTTAHAASFHGKILFCYWTETGCKTLAVYEDGKDGFYMDALPVLTAEEGGRCLFTDENRHICQLDEGGAYGTQGDFFNAETDWDITGRKRLSKLRFEGVGNFVVTIRTSGRVCVRRVSLDGGWAELNLSESGEIFSFDFQLEPGTRIDSMKADLKVLRK
ncbi:MAG: hypothetical protein IJW96_05340 [Clostridia bacterium]|nr:hypothetical protein [Clostridia bacterium]